ncbi:hypothetical protein FJ418_09475 [Mesorhizobium sp. B2-8-3]|nr:hypothetical protein FJ418_09475 [Mesorhizobium sp. B2-8-3]
MPKSVKRLSDDIMLYLFDLEPDDFRSNRPEIIRLQHATGKRKRRPESRRSFNLGDAAQAWSISGMRSTWPG